MKIIVKKSVVKDRDEEKEKKGGRKEETKCLDLRNKKRNFNKEN